MMLNLKPYTGPTKLVVAFDVGTTFSGISYCILEQGQVPEIHGVTRQVLRLLGLFSFDCPQIPHDGTSQWRRQSSVSLVL